MTEPGNHPLENILRLCAAAEPNPWYPSAYARENGIARDSLDPPLDELRMGGLIRLTDWVKDHGQGYVLTPQGKEVLDSARLLGQLQAGTLRVRPAAPVVQPAVGSAHLDRSEAVREALMFGRPPFVNRLLLAANILVFLYGAYLAQRSGIPLNRYLSSPTLGILNAIGGLNSIQMVQGQWWRLLTCCFVHIGFLHLAMNMYTLYVIGPIAERMWGPVRFFILYLLAGIAGSSAAIIANPKIDLLAGASGALCGIIAAVAAWVYLNRLYIPGQLYAAWRGQLIQTFFLIVFISLFPGVSGMAHLGGGIGGLIVGVLLHFQRFGTGWQRLAGTLGVLLVPVICVGLIMQTMKTDPQWEIFRSQVENTRWRTSYAPEVGKLEEAAISLYEKQVMPVGSQPVGQRDPEKIRQALIALQEAEGYLNKAIGMLEQVGAFQDAKLEKERQRYIQVLKDNLGIFDRARGMLTRGEKPT